MNVASDSRNSGSFRLGFDKELIALFPDRALSLKFIWGAIRWRGDCSSGWGESTMEPKRVPSPSLRKTVRKEFSKFRLGSWV
jgi:hypothetical protein